MLASGLHTDTHTDMHTRTHTPTPQSKQKPKSFRREPSYMFSKWYYYFLQGDSKPDRVPVCQPLGAQRPHTIPRCRRGFKMTGTIQGDSSSRTDHPTVPICLPVKMRSSNILEREKERMRLVQAGPFQRWPPILPGWL